jgi:putative ABC transport system substrate-binding protein
MTVLSGAAAYPLLAVAQQKAMPVIGLLVTGSPGPFAANLAALRQRLSETGYVGGQNVAIEFRWAEGDYDRLAGLVGDKVEVIAAGGAPAVLAAKNATSTIPIVFTYVSDPVGIGLVASLARPGGNVTGFSNIAAGLGSKQMELISELVPQVDAIAVLVNPNNPAAELLIRETQLAAHEKGLNLWSNKPIARKKFRE